MSDLAVIALIFGGCLTSVYGWFVAAPEAALSWLKKFPRNAPAGWVLTVVDMAWVTWRLYQTPLGRFEHLRPGLYILVPVVTILIIKCMDELLAPRALGGLFLLLGSPLIEAARLNDSKWSLVITVLAYIMVVKGIVLVLNPYQLRKKQEKFISSPSACRNWGIVGLVISLLVIGLGLFVY